MGSLFREIVSIAVCGRDCYAAPSHHNPLNDDDDARDFLLLQITMCPNRIVDDDDDIIITLKVRDLCCCRKINAVFTATGVWVGGCCMAITHCVRGSER